MYRYPMYLILLLTETFFNVTHMSQQLECDFATFSFVQLSSIGTLSVKFTAMLCGSEWGIIKCEKKKD